MNRYAFTPRYVANHGLTANRITASRAIHQQVAMALHSDSIAVVPAKDPAHHAANSGLFLPGPLGSFRSRRQFAQNLARGILSVADCGHQIVSLAQPIVGSNALQICVFNVFQRDSVLAGFLLDKLPPYFNSALALVDVQPVLDFVS